MKPSFKLASLAAALWIASPVYADFTNGPNPYAPGFGFDTPQEAAWGGWTRGAGDTIWAEWDTFDDGNHTGRRTAAPDIGVHGATNAHVHWNSGTFKAGSGNLYSFSVAPAFVFRLTDSTPIAGRVRAALQTETWGRSIDVASMLLNGSAPTFVTASHVNPAHPSSYGQVTLRQELFYWDLDVAPSSYVFAFKAKDHALSLAQVAIDIGPRAIAPMAIAPMSITPVPEPATYAMLAAGLGLIALQLRRRDKTALKVT